MSIRELDCRSTDSITVRLLWAPESGRLFVDVRDAKMADAFSLEVHDRRSALDVFRHPYAYAGCAGTVTRAPAMLAASFAPA